MPVIRFDIGSKTFTKEQKARFISDLTDLLHEHTGIRREAFLVYIYENNPDNVGVGGIQLSEKLKHGN